MNRKKMLLHFLCVAACISFTYKGHTQKNKKNDLWAYNVLNIPKNKANPKSLKKITIAVIDDGFMLTHKSIAPFLYKNKHEIDGNFLDDDGNRYVDDVSGWDIADDDNNVNLPNGKETKYYHGTFVASLITRIATLHYGTAAKNLIKILPVKVLEDQATQTYLKKGYEGIKYAIDNGADIICLAWSGGFPTEKQKAIIKEAHAKGIIIISSAGNFNTNNVLFPANFTEVISVAGIGINLNKGKYSNFGDNVSISAPSEYVKGAYTTAENAYIYDNGTSAATGLVSGIVALLKTKNSKLNDAQIRAILYNSSSSYQKNNSKYLGLLGSGVINAKNAISSLQTPNKFWNQDRAKGIITLTKENNKIAKTYKINPKGNFEGFHVALNNSKVKRKKKNSISFFLKDTVWQKYTLNNLPKKLFIPSNKFSIKATSKFSEKDVFRISYQGKSIDSTKLYCKEIRSLSKNKGIVNDGSYKQKYANNSSCKWQITAPKGKKIKFEFHKMDTEANIDFVYIVDGERLLQENIIAKFSGNNIPPVVISNTNKVLVWFMTDSKNTKKGWEFKYEFID